MSNDLQRACASAIKKTREEKALSQENLALLCGLDRTYISGIERLKRNPTLKSLEKIISALGMTEAEFLQIIIRELNSGKKN